MKQTIENMSIVATNEKAVTGNANALCATKRFITAKIMIADYQQKGNQMDEIIGNIQDTVEIVDIIKPIYNFKANE